MAGAITMVDTIVTDIITIMDTVIEAATIITMGTAIITDAGIEHSPGVMVTIEIKMSTIGTEAEETDQQRITTEITVITIIGTIKTGTVTNTTTVTTNEVIRERITEREYVIHQERVQLDTVRSISSSFEKKSQLAIISNTFPTINPPNVPTIYPIIAINTPIGISAFE